MDQDLTSSIFNGQSILEENLNDEEIELIKQYLSDMNKIKINNINIINIKLYKKYIIYLYIKIKK